jgi:cyclic beta-1,2-glucan synthetase
MLDTVDWTCDRRECFDARGRLVLPDHFGQRSGVGMDPCAALSTHFVVLAGQATECTFFVGYANTPEAARALSVAAATVPAAARLREVQEQWQELLGAAQIKTPDPLFDAMVNRWLLYQTVSCRLWARAGFYQAGGAFGFRDQLQDAMALAFAAPQMLRAQILRCAARQFVEGDVQHWWHTPGGAGVRTHFSDDLLWLPKACLHYVQSTGDATLWDEPVHFIEAGPIPPGAEDAYTTPTASARFASIYEHGALAIDRSLRVGAHGLPLIGTGDWNDGMNRVGHQGRGESVWLAWFLCDLVPGYLVLAQARGDVEREVRWSAALQTWQAALLGPAWDGQWFKRAFFDGGQALGASANAEARIDLIAQAWAVLSDAAPLAMQQTAMASAQSHLVDASSGLISLLTPPLAHAEPSAGYIQAYPPGVRENGGQYSHGAVWALMAQAKLAHRQSAQAALAQTTTSQSNSFPTNLNPSPTHDDLATFHADAAYRYFTYISPAHRAAHPEWGKAYGIEPYAVAGDVCTQPPYVGRGGWSWYTGAAGWLHRAAIESIFGLQWQAGTVSLRPCLPSHWPQAELTLKRDGRTVRFVLVRESAHARAEAAEPGGAARLRPGEEVVWADLPQSTCFVVHFG